MIAELDTLQHKHVAETLNEPKRAQQHAPCNNNNNTQSKHKQIHSIHWHQSIIHSHPEQRLRATTYYRKHKAHDILQLTTPSCSPPAPSSSCDITNPIC